MKKLVCILLVVMLVVCCVACGESESSTQNGGSNSVQGTDDSSKNNATEEISEVTEAIVRAYKTAPASDFEYEVDGDGIKINKYVGSDSIVVIPDKIDGKPVTQLKSYLFANESSVKGVLIPNTVSTLIYTFTNNKDIQVVICEDVERIQDFTFANCPQLRTLENGTKLVELGQNSISVCPKLEELTIPSTLTNISDSVGWSVFYSCANLTIVGEGGSYIESFCNVNNIPFKSK